MCVCVCVFYVTLINFLSFSLPLSPLLYHIYLCVCVYVIFLSLFNSVFHVSWCISVSLSLISVSTRLCLSVCLSSLVSLSFTHFANTCKSERKEVRVNKGIFFASTTEEKLIVKLNNE